jgi:glycosyltransferase involved in cell wall biosynthesis
MNIGIDIRSLMEKEITGVGEYTYHLLRHLFEIDNKNNYYLFYNSRQDVEKYIPSFPKDNVHYCKFEFPNKLLTLSLKLFNYPKLDQWIIKKYNVSNIDLFIFPNLAFLETNCPYILTSHDLSFEFFPEFLSFKRKLWHKVINPRKLFQNAKKIISVSENTRSDLIDHYLVQPKKIKTIASGINQSYRILNETDPKFKKIRKKYKLPKNFILYLGTIEPRKNIGGLINAFQKFKKKTNSDLELVIAGKLGWKYKQFVKKANLDSQIHFVNFIHDKEKRYFYNMAELFLYPSFYEGFGFPPLEAMACGCPVVTSNNSSMSEVCEDAAILIDPNNIQDIVRAMETILQPENRQNFVEKGLLQAKQFNWYQTAREVLQIIESLQK